MAICNMLYLLYALALFSVLSLTLSLYFFISLQKLKHKYLTNPSLETSLMFADLMRGNAMFHIERVEPENIFLRRPQ